VPRLFAHAQVALSIHLIERVQIMKHGIDRVPADGADMQQGVTVAVAQVREHAVHRVRPKVCSVNMRVDSNTVPLELRKLSTSNAVVSQLTGCGVPVQRWAMPRRRLTGMGSDGDEHRAARGVPTWSPVSAPPTFR